MAIKELFNDARPQVLFDPRASQRIDPRFKFTRDGSATYVDRLGILRTAGANEPRLEYDGATGEQRGLLVEEARTNSKRYSNTFSDGSYVKGYLLDISDGRSVVTQAAIDSPLGPGTGWKLQPNPSASSGGLSITRLEVWTDYIPAGNTKTLSIFAKAGSAGTRLQLHAGVYRASSPIFDLETGTVVSGQGSIQNCGNGWYRCSATSSTDITSGRNFLLNAICSSYSDFIYIAGCQFEAGSFPTSYIPTTTVAVTREPDLLTIETPLPSTGSIYIDARSLSSDVDTTLLSAAPASPSTDKLALAIRQPASLYNSKALVYEVDGAFKPTLPFPVPGVTRERNLITYGANNYHYRSDSARYTPSSSTSVPANMTRLGIGHDVTDPTKAMTGYINAVYIYSGEITPTVAEALVRGELDPVNADTFSPVGPPGALSLVINTQGAAVDGNKVFTLPAESALNDNDIVITWGDNTESGLAGAAAEVGAAGLAHTYPAAGIYPVYVEGKLQNLFFNNSADAKDLLEISAWGTSAGGNAAFTAPSTMNSAFYGCSQLQSIPSTNLPNTSAVTNWFRAFRDCSSLTGTFRSFNFSAATTFQEAFYNCSGITSFTAAGDQTQNVTNFSSAWYGCSGLTSFPLINTAAGTNFTSAWLGCSGLTSFPLITTAAGTNFTSAWQSCSGLTAFPLINTAAGTNFSSAWRGCSSLTSFPSINTGAGTDFGSAWLDCSGLTSFPPINTGAGTNFGSAWQGCSSLTSFPFINTGAGTNFGSAWLNCVSLTSFPLINTSAGTNFGSAWLNCVSLTSFPLINTGAGTNFSRAWYDNNGLTTFPALDFDSATGLASDSSLTFTGFRETWFSCGALTTFPANLFDNTTCTRYLDAFTGCALTAASIENIVVSINAAGTSNGNLSLQGGTNAGASTWTANAVTAYNALVARGWTITRNA